MSILLALMLLPCGVFSADRNILSLRYVILEKLNLNSLDFRDDDCSGEQSYDKTEPTPSPTVSPSVFVSENPSLSPTVSPSVFVSENPSLSPTVIRSVFVSENPSLSPTVLASENPSVSMSPTIAPGSIVTGKSCATNSDCASRFCESTKGICYASSNCKAIKHDAGTEFDQDHLILIFVGSGFTDLTDWSSQIQNTYSTFQGFDFFEDSVTHFSSFYAEDLSDSFCNFGCYGIDRLLCCDVSTARSIGNSCFPAGNRVQHIVIHNDDKYGGAGYISQNMATASSNSQSSLIAVHELGHSLFEFYDEYTYISSTPSGAVNCDPDPSCPRWNDMISTYPNICSSTGCSSGNYRVSEPRSFMKSLNYSVGPVLLRYTCCTFYSLCGSVPTYCDVFTDIGVGLTSYCDQKGYMPDPFVTSLLGGEDPDNVTLERSSISTPGSTYFYIEEPIEIVLNLEEIETSTLPSNSDNIFNTITPTYLPLQPGYYSLTDIDSQNNEIATSSVREEGDVFIKVTIRFESRQQKELYIAAFDLITVPPHESDEEDIHAIRMKKDEVSIVYDLKRYGRVRDVTVIAV